ncbi:MAG: alanine--tRNA ligase-related protein, partial [Nitrospirota bacterium]|nr:alanine--tRNA ligase-related protein [Nitrospirota bacterium]
QTRKSGLNNIPGGELFRLYDTYGFPLDIARDVASEHDLLIDESGFHREMEQQKTKARASWVGEEASASASIYKELFRKHKTTEFVGYDSFDADAKVLAIINNGNSVDELSTGSEGEVLLDRTAFYAESGGQIGDKGQLSADHVRVLVLDTRKPVEGMYMHKIKVVEGSLKAGMNVRGSVDKQKRLSVMRNHTATHLLHASLRNIVGEHVKQAGSFVSDERIRFDFTHFQSLDAKMIEAVEDEVNEAILRNITLDMQTMETKKALSSGVTALFGEKYGDLVRVISVPEVSSELCGGTHAHATGDIGLFKIISEGSVAAGIRRIEAVTGRAAVSFFREEEAELRSVCESLKVSEKPAERISRI